MFENLVLPLRANKLQRSRNLDFYTQNIFPHWICFCTLTICLMFSLLTRWGDDFLKAVSKSLQSKPLRKLTYSSLYQISKVYWESILIHSHTSNQEMLLLATMFRKIGSKKLEKLGFLFQEAGSHQCKMKILFS